MESNKCPVIVERVVNNYWMTFCDIQNNQGRGRGYQSKPKAEADNPYRDLDYSEYHKQSNLIP